MQQVSNLPPSGKTALQYGLIFGLIAALINIGFSAIDAFTYNPSSPSINFGLIFLIILNFLLGWAAFFVGGILASRQTAKVSTGTLAGLWSGSIYGLVGLIVSIMLFFMIKLPQAQEAISALSSTNPGAAQVGLMIAGVGFPIIGLLFAVGSATGLAALGGLWGKYLSKVVVAPAAPMYAVPPYPAPPYPYQAYPGQPAVPQPNLPPQPYPAPPYAGQANIAQPYTAQPYPTQESDMASQSYFEQPH